MCWPWRSVRLRRKNTACGISFVVAEVELEAVADSAGLQRWQFMFLAFVLIFTSQMLILRMEGHFV